MNCYEAHPVGEVGREVVVTPPAEVTTQDASMTMASQISAVESVSSVVHKNFPKRRDHLTLTYVPACIYRISLVIISKF